MPGYVAIKSKATQKDAVVAGKHIAIATPIVPSKAPTSGLVWPKGQR